MKKSNKYSFFDSIFLLFRRLLVVAIVVAVATLAFFGESLSDYVKKNVNLSANSPDKVEDGIIPPKFRIDNQIENQGNQPEIGETAIRSLESTEYRNTQRIADVFDEDTLNQLYDELKQLGASSCRLTYWGDSGNMFRFSCQVPISEHRLNATRTFQSISADAAQSMQEVIEQIRQWRSGR